MTKYILKCYILYYKMLFYDIHHYITKILYMCIFNTQSFQPALSHEDTQNSHLFPRGNSQSFFPDDSGVLNTPSPPTAQREAKPLLLKVSHSQQVLSLFCLAATAGASVQCSQSLLLAPLLRKVSVQGEMNNIPFCLSTMAPQQAHFDSF